MEMSGKPPADAERHFELLVDSVREYAIFMLDTHGVVQSWNEGAKRIKGYEASEIIGKHFSVFYPVEDIRSRKWERELAEATETGRYQDEGLRVRKDGSTFWANVVISPLRDRTGTLIGFAKVTRDLTEHRAAELGRLELARTQEALRLRDEFLSIASHELRTPLVALQLQIDSLRTQGELTTRQRSKVERAGRNVQRMADLISTLLDVSRIAQGRLTLRPKSIDLGALITEVIDRLDESAIEAKCVVTSSLESGIVGSWDPLRVGQVISNLLTNSFTHAAGSAIEVTLARDQDDAVISVRDRGPGIAPDRIERVFDRFERGSSRQVGGMGLGLYVAREIAIAHGGTIDARNRDGGGAMLEVRLPIRQN